MSVPIVEFVFTLALCPVLSPRERRKLCRAFGKSTTARLNPAKETFRLLTPPATKKIEFISRGFHEPEVCRGEAAKVRENRGHVRVIHSEPGGDGRKILINGSSGNPAARAGIVRAVHCERGELAVGLASLNRASGRIPRA